LIDWTFVTFDELTGADLYDILRHRQDVFVLEQKCFYPDIDGKDQVARHLIGRGAHNTFLAYMRILGPGDYYAEPALGRILVTPEARGRGLARALMAEGHARATALYGDVPLRLNAQAYLKDFYQSVGYEIVRGPYDEDGIPHYEMLKAA
jgi:ElaA protein